MRRILGYVIIGLFALLIVAAIGAFGVYRATQHEPDFYTKAMELEPARHSLAGDQLEQQVVQLRNEVRHDGHWEAVFTDEQINGWLAADLPEKFPDGLPQGVSDPRVAIRHDLARIACRYDHGKFSTVVSLALEIHLTDEPNVLAVCIRKVRAGALPIPLSQWLDRVTEATQNADILIRWDQRDGDPEALVTIPFEHADYPERTLQLERVELRDGEIYLSGRSVGSAGESPAANVAQAPAE